jgi:hypothetical protein
VPPKIQSNRSTLSPIDVMKPNVLMVNRLGLALRLPFSDLYRRLCPNCCIQVSCVGRGNGIRCLPTEAALTSVGVLEAGDGLDEGALRVRGLRPRLPRARSAEGTTGTRMPYADHPRRRRNRQSRGSRTTSISRGPPHQSLRCGGDVRLSGRGWSPDSKRAATHMVDRLLRCASETIRRKDRCAERILGRAGSEAFWRRMVAHGFVPRKIW